MDKNNYIEKGNLKNKQGRKGLVELGLIPDWLDKIFLRSVTPLINFFSSVRIDPNWITTLGFVQNVVASVLIFYGEFILAAVFIGIAGIFDFIDGKVAAVTRRTTTFGAIFDSILDRYSDIVIYLAITLYYLKGDFDLSVAFSIVAIVGSVMTSYVKAVGESHGFKFRMGALRRQERVTLIFFGLLFTFAHQAIADFLEKLGSLFHLPVTVFPIMPLSLIVYFLAVFTNFTALQRIVVLHRVAKKSEQANNKL